MDLSAVINTIQQLIGQGETEKALIALENLLASNAQYAELADIARINQAAFYELKSKELKRTISPDEAQVTGNRIKEKALEILQLIAEGRYNLASNPVQQRVSPWRYYIAGAIVALALTLIGWRAWGGQLTRKDACPTFSTDVKYRIVVLPFKQTGLQRKSLPEIDIADGINVLADKTPGLRAAADVHENYDTETNYPNPAEATEIAKGCDAQMIVWGKVNQTSTGEYKLDVRYKLLQAGEVRFSGDTTINQLLSISQEGQFIKDVEAVTYLLYSVIANHNRISVAIRAAPPTALTQASSMKTDGAVDTVASLILADAYLTDSPTKAKKEFDKILEAYPTNQTALLKRGALLYTEKNYEAAARDFEMVSSLHSADFSQTRINTFLKSGQPDKASREIKELTNNNEVASTWVKTKELEIADSVTVLKKEAEIMEKKIAAAPKDKNTRVKAGKTNLAIGDADRALVHAQAVTKSDPKNLDALEIAVEAHLIKGDTTKALQVIEQAERKGVNVKTVTNRIPTAIKPLNRN